MNLFKYIKQQSPLLNIKKYLKYNHIVFLDNAASTQKPCSLLENQTIYYSKYNSNVNRGSYKLANKNSLLYNKSRLRISKLLNCKGSNNVILLSGGTEAFNFVQNSFCSKFLKNNDNVILSILEHHSNIIPWILLSIKLNIKLKFIGICTNGYLNFLHYIKTVDKHTKFISLVHVSNLLGLINPIAKFSNISSVLNIPFLIDGTQYIIHNRANVLKYKCDFYIFSSHKVMSSFGVGVLYINDKWLNIMLPHRVGGGIVKNFLLNKKIFLKKNFNSYESGTPNIESCINLGIIYEYLNFLGFNKIHSSNQKSIFYFKKWYINYKLKYSLIIFPSIQEYNYFNKIPLFSFYIKNIHAHDVASYLNNNNIMCRSGYHCAQPFIERSLNLNSLSRLSATIFNSYYDIYFFYKIIQKIIYNL